MSNRLAFQTQLASVMEVLANAAVAEICKLVDDDYAVILLQMSQCQRENKVLKRKLHLFELRMARGNAERRIRESAMSNRSNRVHVNANINIGDKYRAPTSGEFFFAFQRTLASPMLGHGNVSSEIKLMKMNCYAFFFIFRTLHIRWRCSW